MKARLSPPPVAPRQRLHHITRPDPLTLEITQ